MISMTMHQPNYTSDHVDVEMHKSQEGVKRKDGPFEQDTTLKKPKVRADVKIRGLVSHYLDNEFDTAEPLTPIMREQMFKFGVGLHDFISREGGYLDVEILANKMDSGFKEIEKRLAAFEKPVEKTAEQTYAMATKRFLGNESSDDDGNLSSKREDTSKFSIIEMEDKIDDEGFKIVKQSLAKKLNGVRVDRVVRTKAGNISLEFNDSNHQTKADNILMSSPLPRTTVRSSTKRNVALALRGVPMELSDDELQEQIRRKNPDLQVFKTTEWSLISAEQPSRKLYGTKKLVVPVAVAKQLLHAGRIYIDLHSLNLELWKPNIGRCGNCLEKGHNRRDCSQANVCIICAGNHWSSACPNSKSAASHRCIVCTRNKIEARHMATSKHCPTLHKETECELDRMMNKIYG